MEFDVKIDVKIGETWIIKSSSRIETGEYKTVKIVAMYFTDTTEQILIVPLSRSQECGYNKRHSKNYFLEHYEKVYS